MSVGLDTMVAWRRAVYEVCSEELANARTGSDNIRHYARMRVRRMLECKTPGSRKNLPGNLRRLIEHHWQNGATQKGETAKTAQMGELERLKYEMARSR
jgi:hypothetical protein